MLLLVASCVDRSLVRDTVRDYSAYDIITYVFQTRVLLYEKKIMSVLSNRQFGRIYIQSQHHPGTIGSYAGIGIHPNMIPPRTVWKSQPRRPTF